MAGREALHPSVRTYKTKRLIAADRNHYDTSDIDGSDGSSSDDDAIDRVTNTAPLTPPVETHRLQDALATLQRGFELSNAQIAILPSLQDISLTPQSDSNLVMTLEKFHGAHPFKLYVGAMKWQTQDEITYDPAYVYLFKGATKQMQMRICNGAIEQVHWTPFDAQYFGSVTHLAFPFNGRTEAVRRVAIAKYYFLLGLDAGLYDVDPGWTVTESLRKQLQSACDDLIHANKLHTGNKVKALAAKRAREQKSTNSAAPDNMTREIENEQQQVKKSRDRPGWSQRPHFNRPGYAFDNPPNRYPSALMAPDHYCRSDEPDRLVGGYAYPVPEHALPSTPGLHPSRPSSRQEDEQLPKREKSTKSHTSSKVPAPKMNTQFSSSEQW
jgi:hypothetical protein